MKSHCYPILDLIVFLQKSLLYLAIAKPYITFVVELVNRFIQVRRKPHLETTKKILKYVKTTLVMGLYKYNTNASLHCFTDVDLGGDSNDQKSTPDDVFLCGDTNISWYFAFFCKV